MHPTILTAEASEREQRAVAASLARRGLGTGDRVALSVAGSPTYVSVVLGALRSGVVPVPLDPRLTPWERDGIIADVEPALQVLDEDELRALADGPADGDLADFPRARPMHFTSGTTGRPKGVWSGLLSDENSAVLALEERELWGFRADDLDLVVSPVYHSAPLRFAMGTLLAGGSIAVLPTFSPQGLLAALPLRPTSMFCVPAHLQRLFQHLDETGEQPDVSSFRLVAHAGAPCPEPVRRRAHELFGTDVVWEFYGSTEGQWTACPAPVWQASPGTLGAARPHRTITTDADDQLWCSVPEWARFEYWRDPEKTAAAWKDTPDGPAFTVGDLGRVEKGLVYLDARRTDLIISGGVNVYPAEVEDALADVPGLLDLAVFGRPDERWGQRVCAAYVGEVDEDALRALAVERLAPPKRPKEYERLDALPRTATGKVRRTELA
ncbi:AMP-dependent synthetase [Aeromicrobium sp. Root495]|nr:AMP-dependent synthetase [Aeromicrobium sp. Root495]